MNITVRPENRSYAHKITLRTGANEHSLEIAPKTDGFGSSVNGGELLFLAMATCYSNDLYREARKRGIVIREV